MKAAFFSLLSTEGLIKCPHPVATPGKAVMLTDQENERTDSLSLLTCFRAGRLYSPGLPHTPIDKATPQAALECPGSTGGRLAAASQQQLLPQTPPLGPGNARLGSSLYRLPEHLLRTDGVKRAPAPGCSPGPILSSPCTAGGHLGTPGTWRLLGKISGKGPLSAQLAQGCPGRAPCLIFVVCMGQS